VGVVLAASVAPLAEYFGPQVGWLPPTSIIATLSDSVSTFSQAAKDASPRAFPSGRTDPPGASGETPQTAPAARQEARRLEVGQALISNGAERRSEAKTRIALAAASENPTVMLAAAYEIPPPSQQTLFGGIKVRAVNADTEMPGADKAPDGNSTPSIKLARTSAKTASVLPTAPRHPEPIAGPAQPATPLATLEGVATVAARPNDVIPAPRAEPIPRRKPDPYASVPTLRELPRKFRRKVPEIDIYLHVYATDPAGRFVRINRRNFRESDQVARGLTLETITPDGLVMVLRERRFQIAKP
jgi:general secretion pathway protein B